MEPNDDTLLETNAGPAHATGGAASPRAYELGPVIGRGGMGEVLLARDPSIGRDVAIKRMRSQLPPTDHVERFLREARIQGRLDHPAVVPVHELGRDPEGRPFFVMKRLAGVTLAERLAANAPRQPLLRAFADVCSAVAFAHSRNIVHRDLKPSNIMLGEYGEVYVLDWGLARVLGEDPEDPTGVGDLVSLEGATQTGEMLGTPGYMAPEQMRDAANATGPADVYALGAILFELLAGEPVHPRGNAALASTLADDAHAPAHRRPDREIPPELDALCSRALDADLEHRPSARELGASVQAYLDGDRDLERRRALAASELAAARAALDDRRPEAMRAAGRALALDPRSGAAELVTRLMLEPPVVQPPGLVAALRAADAESVKRHALASFVGLAGVVAFTPLVVWNGVRDWSIVGSIVGLAALLAGAAFSMYRQPHRSDREMLLYLVGAMALIPLVGRLCGPLILVPGLACLVVWALLMYPTLVRYPWVVFGVAIAAWLVPVALERAGVLASTWSIEDSTIASRVTAIDVSGNATAIFIFASSLLTVAVAAFHGTTLSRANVEAKRRLVAQAWHLRQLLPADSE